MKPHRVKRIHGFWVPPRKKKDRPAPVTIDFAIPGVIPSKKNRQIATINRSKAMRHYQRIAADKGAKNFTQTDFWQILQEIKPYIRPAKAVKKWVEKTQPLLTQQAATWKGRLEKRGINIIYPITECSITIYHYWKDNRIRDNSGKAETLHDLFVSAGIITDDCWQNLTPTAADADLYEDCTDHMTIINISAYTW